jgi:predicted TIM-barrel fold metal-dependent hydrolase
MRDGMFVFDNAVHAYDNTDGNVVPEKKEEALAFSGALGHGTEWMLSRELKTRFLQYDDRFPTGRMEIDRALFRLFEEGDTDLAMAMTVPVAGYWKDFSMPLRYNYALKEAAPDKVLFCGGVDPNTMSTEECLKAIEWQVRELDAKSIKFYQCGPTNQHWMADDQKIAYPLYAKCQEMGIKCIQFHKGFGFHNQFDGPWMHCLDLQQPALDFPDLNFLIHHVGYPHEDESINVIARFSNMSVSLAGILQFYGFAPMQALHILGKTLLWIGVDRTVYGSEAFVWPYVNGAIDILAEIQFPERMQEDYGYPRISPEDREKMFGLNHARLLDYDLTPHLEKARAAA